MCSSRSLPINRTAILAQDRTAVRLRAYHGGDAYEPAIVGKKSGKRDNGTYYANRGLTKYRVPNRHVKYERWVER